MCRWPNGDLSFVSARNREDAIIALDELDNAEVAELRQVRDFMVDFRLTDSGDLELQSFEESCQEDIWNPEAGATENDRAGKKAAARGWVDHLRLGRRQLGNGLSSMRYHRLAWTGMESPRRCSVSSVRKGRGRQRLQWCRAQIRDAFRQRAVSSR